MIANTNTKPQAVHPLARFPAEIWLEIAASLTPLHRKLRQMSSNSVYEILSKGALPPLYPDDQITLRIIAEDDWLHLPAHQVCVICDKYHARQRVQPRSGSCNTPNSSRAICSCIGGIRLSADKILCQGCWSQLLLNKENSTPRSSFAEAWLHEWRVEKRGSSLMLKTKSIMSEDVSRSSYDDDWNSVANEKLLAGVTWCGCNRQTLKHKLCGQMKFKLLPASLVDIRCFPNLSIPDPRSFARINIGYLRCGSLYICSINTQRKFKKVVVTRFLNLSSASTFAAHLGVEQADSPGMIPGGRIASQARGPGEISLHQESKPPALQRCRTIRVL